MKPITRANFAIGAEKEKQYGYRINEKCIGCGLCTSNNEFPIVLNFNKQEVKIFDIDRIFSSFIVG